MTRLQFFRKRKSVLKHQVRKRLAITAEENSAIDPIAPPRFALRGSAQI